jgi:hypothetical protein
MLHRASELDGFFGITKATEMDMRFGIWNLRSLYKAGSLKTVASELGRYHFDLMALQEVR